RLAREAGIVPDRGEVLVVLRRLPELCIRSYRGGQVLEGRVPLAGARFHAREVVEDRPAAGLRLEALLEQPLPLRDPSRLQMWRGEEEALPGRDLVGGTRLAADCEHRGVV